MLELEQSALVLDAAQAIAPDSIRGDDPVTGDDEREAVVRAHRAHGPLGVRIAGERGQLPVRDNLTPRNAAERLDDSELEGRQAVEVELDVAEGLACAAEIRAQPGGQLVRGIGTD